jgi:hypothetical protein
MDVIYKQARLVQGEEAAEAVAPGTGPQEGPVVWPNPPGFIFNMAPISCY